MTNDLSHAQRPLSPFILVLGFVMASCWFCTNAAGQTTKATDGSTPIALQAGAPAGSYSLGGFDNVNLYSGGLGANLPLLSIGGRGGAGHTITLPFERHTDSLNRVVTIDYDVNEGGSYGVCDKMGRVVRQYQRTDSVNYLTEATYNLKPIGRSTPAMSVTRKPAWTLPRRGSMPVFRAVLQIRILLRPVRS